MDGVSAEMPAPVLETRAATPGFACDVSSRVPPEPAPSRAEEACPGRLVPTRGPSHATVADQPGEGRVQTGGVGTLIINDLQGCLSKPFGPTLAGAHQERLCLRR